MVFAGEILDEGIKSEQVVPGELNLHVEREFIEIAPWIYLRNFMPHSQIVFVGCE